MRFPSRGAALSLNKFSTTAYLGIGHSAARTPARPRRLARRRLDHRARLGRHWRARRPEQARSEAAWNGRRRPWRPRFGIGFSGDPGLGDPDQLDFPPEADGSTPGPSRWRTPSQQLSQHQECASASGSETGASGGTAGELHGPRPIVNLGGSDPARRAVICRGRIRAGSLCAPAASIGTERWRAGGKQFRRSEPGSRSEPVQVSSGFERRDHQLHRPVSNAPKLSTQILP